MTIPPSRARTRATPAPVEPLLEDGGIRPATLSDAQLLDRLLGRCDAGKGGPIAGALFARFGGLGGVVTAAPGELARAGDLSVADTDILALARELAVRLARVEAARRPVITSWTALLDYVRVALAHAPREQFRALYLDKHNRLIREELVAEGTIDHAPVYPREVVRRGLELSASALILVHNHPSGDPTPSRADIEMTRRIIDAARVFDLLVHDHVVVGSGGTASFKRLGLI